jgi:hypothetical protein
MPPGSGRSTIRDITDAFLGTATLDSAAAEDSVAGARRPVEVVMAAHLGPDRTCAIERYVDHVCARGRRVALLTVSPENTQLRWVQPAGLRGAYKAADTTLPDEGFREDEGPPAWPCASTPRRDWSAAITESVDAFDRLLVVPQPADYDEDPHALGAAPAVTVLVRSSEAGQLAAYKALKGHQAQLLGRPVGLFVIDAVDPNDGAATGRRLSQLVRRFLGLSLCVLGSAIRSTTTRQVVVAQDLAPGGRGRTDAQWADELRDVVDCVGLAAPENGHAGAYWGLDETDGADAEATGWEIDFAVTLDEPLRTVPQVREFVEAHLGAFYPEAEHCDAVTGCEVGGADYLRARTPTGRDALLVLALASAPGALELLLAREAELRGVTDVVWIGHKPTREQFLAARRLGLRVRHVVLHHVCVDGHLGLLVRDAYGAR